MAVLRVQFLTGGGAITATRVVRPSDERRAEALSRFAAYDVVRQLRRGADRPTVIKLYGLARGMEISMPSRLRDSDLFPVIESTVASGRILFTRGWDFGSGRAAIRPVGRDASAGAASAHRSVVHAVMGGRNSIPFEGAQYILCEATTLAAVPGRDQYQVVRLSEARAVLSRLSTRGENGDAKAKLTQASEWLRDKPPRGNESGLYLLRKVSRSYVPPQGSEAPVTPAQMKPAPPKLGIEIKFVEAGTGRAIKDTAFLVKTPDGAQSRHMTSAAGSLKLSGLDPGQCTVTSIIDDATMTLSFRPGAAGDDADDAEADGAPGAGDGASAEGGLAASGSASASASASAASKASVSGGFGLKVDVGALAKGDLKGGLGLSGGLSGGLSAKAAASATASASAAVSGFAAGSLSASASAGAALGAGGAGARNRSPIGPAFIVETETHHVATGETLELIAAKAGVSADVLAKFNFETTDPAQLQTFYRERVGCTKKTPDGKDYVFDDSDKPGAILIPKPWEASFAVGEVHKVRVGPMRAVYIYLENEEGLALPGASYECVFVDKSERTGTLGPAGVARLDGVPEGPFSVSYPDSLDLLARSLAASTRKAFDAQDTGPLFYLLGQEQEVVDRAVAVYEEYFDDLTGEGFAADIDQVVTDPDARPPLVFLCKLAGIDVEGTANAVVQRIGGGAEDDG